MLRQCSCCLTCSSTRTPLPGASPLQVGRCAARGMLPARCWHVAHVLLACCSSVCLHVASMHPQPMIRVYDVVYISPTPPPSRQCTWPGNSSAVGQGDRCAAILRPSLRAHWCDFLGAGVTAGGAASHPGHHWLIVDTATFDSCTVVLLPTGFSPCVIHVYRCSPPSATHMRCPEVQPPLRPCGSHTRPQW